MKKRITMLLMLLTVSLVAWSSPDTIETSDFETDVTEINKNLTTSLNLDTNNSTSGSNAEGDKLAKKMKRQLAGEWGNNSRPVQITPLEGSAETREAFMTYRFNQDGTYLKTLKSGNYNLHEGGIWNISKDGKYLVLHKKTQQDELPSDKAELIKIKYLELDELVLEQKVKEVCTQRANYYFNKR